MKSPILIAAAVTSIFASLSAAQAGKIAKAGVSQEERQRLVRDHRGPHGVRGGGVKVTRTCDKVKHPHCHSH